MIMVHIKEEHPITGEKLTSREYDMTTKAYEMMTPEEIKMSEQREGYIRKIETHNFLIDLKINKLPVEELDLNPPRAGVFA